jgi:hypothetical protein
VTREGKAREWWISAAGLRSGIGNLVRARTTVRGYSGQTLKWNQACGSRLRLRSDGSSSRLEHREVVRNHVAGALNPYGARAWGGSERRVNRKRGARRLAIGSRDLEWLLEL